MPGDPQPLRYREARPPRAPTLAGPDTRARPAGAGGPAVGVRLRPGAAATLGPCGAALRDEHPSAGAAWGADGDRLERELGEAVPGDRARLLLRAVAARAEEAPPTDAAVALLASGGTTVADVARTIGTGERRLRRRFAEHVGYGPKTLDRVLRLQRLLTLAITTDDDLAGLAFAAGYADQAHMARETRALADATPSQLVAARRPAVSETSNTSTRLRGRMGS